MLFRFFQNAEQIVADLKRALKALEASHLPILNETLQAFYSPGAILPQGQSPEQLAGWFSQSHPRYNLSCWCFFGRLTDAGGRTAAISTMIQAQRIPGQLPYLSEWSYCDDQTNGYVLAPFFSSEGNVEYSHPFAITVDANPVYAGFITLSLASGRMGEKGAQYRLTGRVMTLPFSDLAEWNYEIVMTDSFGCIKDGYGPSAFLPQWMNAGQRTIIGGPFEGNVRAFLESGQDDMVGQGSYYYSIPLLNVDRFSVTRNGKPYSSGTQGEFWVDYVVQGFNDSSLQIVKTASWLFFGIQFPEIPGYDGARAAMIFSVVETSVSGETSQLATARFYDGRLETISQNGAHEAAFDWTMEQIQYTILETYEDLTAKEKYPTKVRISLAAPEGSVVMTLSAVRPNQVVPFAGKYEGVYDVVADISLEGIAANGVSGFAWGEAGSTSKAHASPPVYERSSDSRTS